MNRTCFALLATLAAMVAQRVALASPIAVAFGTLTGGSAPLLLPNPGNAAAIAFSVAYDGYDLSGTICDSNVCGPGFGTAIPQVDLLNFTATCVAANGCGEFSFSWGETLDTGIPYDPSVTPGVLFSSHIGGTFTVPNPTGDVIVYDARVNQGGLDATGHIPANGSWGHGQFNPTTSNSFTQDFGPLTISPFPTPAADLLLSMGWDLSIAGDKPGDSLTLPQSFINLDLPVNTAAPEPSNFVLASLGLGCLFVARLMLPKRGVRRSPAD